eukprot:TRINITY_DN6923_c0_g1_i11.p1 TRINITY_DN6923_c0_g1~~TRINITY_DN6923_c0_g1_i11.p1  ORF type:complete len:475 (-),score=100.83 TRINITY_DN6923_c0_g1_i11:33-1457(-)
MVEFTLQQMFKGGIRDHLGGGFHRYSTDATWHVPHFEKMLYDQAQLAQSYVTAFQITGKKMYQEAICDTLDYVIRVLKSPTGGFFSAEDADSKLSHTSEEHAEGAYYVWEYNEIKSVLGNLSETFVYQYGIERGGNVPSWSDPHNEFKNKNILIQRHSVQETAHQFGKSVEEITQMISNAKELLFSFRSNRPRPFLDDKIITSWNGLTISALTRASQVLNKQNYLEHAISAMSFILENLYKDGHLIRNYKDGASNIYGFSSDYAFVITALLDLYQATANLEYLKQAITLQDRMDELFYDLEAGGYFNAPIGKNDNIIQIKEEQDGAEPSATSYSCTNLMKLFYITRDEKYLKKVSLTLASYSRVLLNKPNIFPQLLTATDLFFRPPTQVVLYGNTSPKFREMQQIVYSKFIPTLNLLFVTNLEDLKYFKEVLGLELEMPKTSLENDDMTAVVCKDLSCQLPTSNAQQLMKLLSE